MGIEDFLVDSNEHAERVLLISPDSEQSSKMQSVLNSKHVCSHADSLVAAQYSAMTIYSM